MRILNGWKEIAECLHRTPRSARRWERLGLPVQRLTESRRSPVVAFHEEIELWVRRNRLDRRGSVRANTASFRPTRRESVDLNPDARELREQLDRLRKLAQENRRLRADLELARENLWKSITLCFPRSHPDTPVQRTSIGRLQ